MNPKEAKKDILAQIFMPAWFSRWLIFSSFAVIWWNSPRTMYSIFFVIDLAFIGLAFASMKGIWKPLALLFGMEEVFIAIWHMSQLILFADFFKGGAHMGSMSEGAVKFWSWITILCILACLLIELAVLGLGIISTDGENKAKDADSGSSDLELEVAASGTELNNKIAVYQSMRRNGNDGVSNLGSRQGGSGSGGDEQNLVGQA